MPSCHNGLWPSQKARRTGRHEDRSDKRSHQHKGHYGKRAFESVVMGGHARDGEREDCKSSRCPIDLVQL